MRKLSLFQRRTIAEFFTNGAVAWLTVGIITPALTGQSFVSAFTPFVWGSVFTATFLSIAIGFSKGGRS